MGQHTAAMPGPAVALRVTIATLVYALTFPLPTAVFFVATGDAPSTEVAPLRRVVATLSPPVLPHETDEGVRCEARYAYEPHYGVERLFSLSVELGHPSLREAVLDCAEHPGIPPSLHLELFGDGTVRVRDPALSEEAKEGLSTQRHFFAESRALLVPLAAFYNAVGCMALAAACRAIVARRARYERVALHARERDAWDARVDVEDFA